VCDFVSLHAAGNVIDGIYGACSKSRGLSRVREKLVRFDIIVIRVTQIIHKRSFISDIPRITDILSTTKIFFFAAFPLLTELLDFPLFGCAFNWLVNLPAYRKLVFADAEDVGISFSE